MPTGTQAVLVGPQPYGARVQLRYAYRLDPTPGQRQALARAFGCARVVFNDAVAARRTAREAGQSFPTDAALSTALTQAKRTPARAWLAEVSAVVLQQALADANTAYRNLCATRRFIAFPAQPGGTGGKFLDLMAYPGSKETSGTRACQKTDGRVQANGATCRGIRMIWLKLDCLHPNLQRCQGTACRKVA